MSMVCRNYTVRFVTPAFLGDAEQKGAWRTPPFKALLRQWWRVVVAKHEKYDWKKIREREGCLFGHAWLEEHHGKKWAMKSQIQIRLTPWEKGKLPLLEKSGQVCHPEVDNPRMPPCPDSKTGRMIDANLYLGYGPVGPKGLVNEPAISPKESANFSLCHPEEMCKDIDSVLELIQLFGALGGRSRNGWGSVLLAGEGMREQQDILNDPVFLEIFGRPINECLDQDWVHALGIGEDGRLLIWKTDVSSEWAKIMKVLATIKISYRTNLKFTGKSGPLEQRHILSYPVTNHQVKGWENARVPNQLRFKIIKDRGGNLVGLVYHLPCSLPDNLAPSWSKERQLEVWRKVHFQLDKELMRVEGKGAK